MFKWFLVFFISLCSYAQNPVLVCLGQEELLLHQKKEVGPVYKLNQYLIGELASANQIAFRKKFIDAICQSKDFSPSVNLLRLILIEGKSLYIFKGDVFQKAMEESTIDNFIDNIPEVFFKYLSSLQALTPHHKCLKNYISHLDYFQTRYRYLGEELSNKIFEEDKSKIKVIFEDLKNLDQILIKCKDLALKDKPKG